LTSPPADLDNLPAVVQYRAAEYTYMYQLSQSCGAPPYRGCPVASSAGLQHEQPSSAQQQATAAGWAAAGHAWAELAQNLTGARLESVLLSLNAADIAHLLASWHHAGLPTSKRTLRRLLFVSGRLLKPDSPPLTGRVLAPLSCAALIVPDNDVPVLKEDSTKWQNSNSLPSGIGGLLPTCELPAWVREPPPLRCAALTCIPHLVDATQLHNQLKQQYFYRSRRNCLRPGCTATAKRYMTSLHLAPLQNSTDVITSCTTISISTG
jgi:hypothetical protein